MFGIFNFVKLNIMPETADSNFVFSKFWMFSNDHNVDIP